MRRALGFAGLVLVLATSACAGGPKPLEKVIRDQQLPAFIRDSDLILEGDLVAGPSSSGRPGVRLQVGNIWAGVCLTDTVPFYYLRLPDESIDELVPGARILFWGFREKEAAHRLMGRVAVFNSHSRDFRYAVNLADGDVGVGRAAHSLRRAQLLDDSKRGLLARRRTEAGQWTAIVAYRVAGHTRTWPDTLLGQHPALIAGRAVEFPTLLTSERNDWTRHFAIGDTAVIALRPANAGQRVFTTTEDLDQFWLVRWQVPHFGMSLDEIRRAAVWDSTSGTLRLVRP